MKRAHYLRKLYVSIVTIIFSTAAIGQNAKMIDSKTIFFLALKSKRLNLKTLKEEPLTIENNPDLVKNYMKKVLFMNYTGYNDGNIDRLEPAYEDTIRNEMKNTSFDDVYTSVYVGNFYSTPKPYFSFGYDFSQAFSGGYLPEHPTIEEVSTAEYSRMLRLYFLNVESGHDELLFNINDAKAKEIENKIAASGIDYVAIVKYFKILPIAFAAQNNDWLAAKLLKVELHTLIAPKPGQKKCSIGEKLLEINWPERNYSHTNLY